MSARPPDHPRNEKASTAANGQGPINKSTRARSLPAEQHSSKEKTTAKLAVEYVNFGWALVTYELRKKGPTWKGWNLRENALTTEEQVVKANLHGNIGLLHAYSGTCCLDIDNLKVARAELAANGIDVDKLIKESVRIDRGYPSKTKCLWLLPPGVDPLQTVMRNRFGYELRCKSSTGKSVQDVLPPSIHPSEAQYRWIGDPARLTVLPPEVFAHWNKLTVRPEHIDAAPTGIDCDELDDLLELIDPNELEYDDWLTVGMGLHHETEGAPAGLELWDCWSAQSHKYIAEMQEPKWNSFDPHHPNPVTIKTLQRMARGEENIDEEFEDLTKLEPDAAPSEGGEPALKAPQFEFLQAGAFAARPHKPMLIPDLEPGGADLGLTVGAYGTGKSAFLLNKVMHQATGRAWRGRRVKQQSTAIIVAEGSYGLGDRLTAEARAFGVDLKELPIFILPASPNFYQKADAPEIVKAIEAIGGVNQIVCDTFARVTAGADENSSKDIELVVSRFEWITRRTGARIHSTHHEGKDSSKGPRGSTALPSAADYIHTVTRSGDHRQVEVTKMKDGPDGQIFPFRLVPVIVGFDSEENEITGVTVEHTDDQKPIKTRQGPNEVLLLKTAHEYFSEHHQHPDANTLIRLTSEKRARELKIPQHVAAKNIRRALNNLYEKRLLVLVDGLVTSTQ